MERTSATHGSYSSSRSPEQAREDDEKEEKYTTTSETRHSSSPYRAIEHACKPAVRGVQANRGGDCCSDSVQADEWVYWAACVCALAALHSLFYLIKSLKKFMHINSCKYLA